MKKNDKKFGIEEAKRLIKAVINDDYAYFLPISKRLQKKIKRERVKSHKRRMEYVNIAKYSKMPEDDIFEDKLKFNPDQKILSLEEFFISNKNKIPKNYESLIYKKSVFKNNTQIENIIEHNLINLYDSNLSNSEEFIIDDKNNKIENDDLFNQRLFLIQERNFSHNDKIFFALKNIKDNFGGKELFFETNQFEHTNSILNIIEKSSSLNLNEDQNQQELKYQNNQEAKSFNWFENYSKIVDNYNDEETDKVKLTNYVDEKLSTVEIKLEKKLEKELEELYFNTSKFDKKIR